LALNDPDFDLDAVAAFLKRKRAEATKRLAMPRHNHQVFLWLRGPDGSTENLSVLFTVEYGKAFIN
jgi:hypothetical protein